MGRAQDRKATKGMKVIHLDEFGRRVDKPIHRAAAPVSKPRMKMIVLAVRWALLTGYGASPGARLAR